VARKGVMHECIVRVGRVRYGDYHGMQFSSAR
jgi:hypothetical protein